MKNGLIITLTLFLVWGCRAKETQVPEKPNIIFVMADDLGYGDLGCYGQEKIQTPNIDQMAAEGMRFTDHYSGSTVCMPSRASLLTGYDQGHASVRGNPVWTNSGQPVNLNPHEWTVANELKKGGYHTAIIGKWGLGPKAISHRSMVLIISWVIKHTLKPIITIGIRSIKMMKHISLRKMILKANREITHTMCL